MSHTLPTPPDSTPSSPQEDKSPKPIVATSSISSLDVKASSPVSEQSDSTDEESFGTMSRSTTTPSLIPDEDDDIPRFDEIPYPLVTPTGSPTLVTPPSPGKTTTSLPKITPHPYPRPSTPAANPRGGRSRLSGLGISPLTQVSPHPMQSGLLPKSQPLSRALFNRNSSDSNHSGIPGKKKIGQKLIVPNKAFKTTFELQLTSSEFARKAY